jgi:AraC-like DNA-binding protein
MFNMSLEKLGYLTGRSLSTFNRDFKKLFNTTPQKWLTDKRLELAHYQLLEKRKSRRKFTWRLALKICPIFRLFLKRNTVCRLSN